MRIIPAKDNLSNTAQTFWVGMGSLSSLAFSLLSSVILSHFLPKGDYGTYKQVLYVYSTLLTIFTLGLPRAFSYFLPRMGMEEGKDVALKINYMLLAVGAVFSAMLYFSAPFIAEAMGNPDLHYAMKLFSTVPLLMLPTMGMEGIFATYKKTYISAIYIVLTRIFTLFCVALPVMLFNGDYISAIKGFVAASFLQFILAIALEVWLFKDVKKRKSGTSYKDIVKFSLPLMIANLWNWVIVSADQFFISRFFGQSVFAEYSNGATGHPIVSIIVGATSTVLVPVLSKKIHEKEDFRQTMLPTMRNVFAKTAMLTYPIIFFSWFFAPEIIQFLYGETYAASSIYFRILLISGLFSLVSTNYIIIAMGANRFYAKVHMYSAIILVAAQYLCVTFISSPYALVGISVVSHLGRICVMFAFIMRTFKTKFKEFIPWRLLLDISIPSIIILVCLKYILGLLPAMNNFVSLLIGGLGYCILYLGWTVFRKIDYISIVKPFFSKNNPEETE